jgi:hypothetical protein
MTHSDVDIGVRHFVCVHLLGLGLRYPIGEHIYHFIWLCLVVGDEMYSEVMLAIHTFVHHEHA